jgi:hypothetical protein
VDGRPLPLRVTGSTAGALAGEPLVVMACDRDSASVRLTAGDHRVETAQGLATGLDLDRLVLRSATWPMPQSAPSSRAAILVDHEGRTEIRGTLTGVAAGTPAAWFVLGQGHNPGWHLTIGGQDLGASQVVDGGSNGWLVSADASASLAGTTVDGRVPFALTWTPQRVIDWTLRASGLAVLACLALLVVGGRGEADATTDGDGGSVVPARSPVALACAMVTAVVAVLVIGPLWGLVALAVTLPAALYRRCRYLPAAVAVALTAAAALYYVARTWRSRPPPGFGWTENYEWAHRPVLLAAVLIAAHAVLEQRRQGER